MVESWSTPTYLVITAYMNKRLGSDGDAGFLRRINKLLFHGIKPVFVFDGGAPALKRATIVRRPFKSGAVVLTFSGRTEAQEGRSSGESCQGC
jgi:5'-3' exonuclease